MKVFDQIEAATIDRREWHLWLLAATIIFVMSSGLALLMYPTVFSNPVILSGSTLRKAFFGFCAISILLIGYLLDRHWVIRQLRKALAEESQRNLRFRQQASIDLLASLPGFAHFQDRLAMEFRRAANIQKPLSLLTVSLTSSPTLSDPGEVSTAFGDAAKALVRRMRVEDSMYLFQTGVFGIIVPGVNAQDAYRLADRLGESLHDASGASNRFSSDLRVINYPEHVEGAREMELMARAGLTESRTDAPPGADSKPSEPALNQAQQK